MESIGAQKPQVISSRIIARNTFLNVISGCIPLATAVIAVPLLIHGFGTERYGLLTLFWMVIGYLGLLDLGIGRATTKFVADRLARNDHDDLPPLVWTSWTLLLGLGVLAGLVIVMLVPVLLNHVFSVPPYLRTETTASLYWLALFMPLGFIIAGAQGVLAAQQRFDVITAIQIPAGLSGYLIPLFVLLYTQDLSVVVWALGVGRTVVGGVYIWCCLRSMPALWHYRRSSGRHMKDLLHFGGWLTVSGVINPLMLYLDRFLIGTILTFSAVTYYSTSYNVTTQLWIISGSLAPVIFSAFSTLASQRSSTLASEYRRAVKYLFLAVLPFTIALMVLANDLMTLWLGAEFAAHSAPVLAVLAIGVLIIALAQVPCALIQASARPDITAKFHLLEAVPYFALIWWAIADYGVIGAAIAWVIRAAVDAVLLFWFADRLLPLKERGLAFVVVLLPVTAGLYGVTTLATGIMTDGMGRVAMVAVIMGLAAVSVWRLWLSPDEKALILRCGMAVPRLDHPS